MGGTGSGAVKVVATVTLYQVLSQCLPPSLLLPLPPSSSPSLPPPPPPSLPHQVRTKDDALITVKLMVFFELREIETMLNKTTDPIADFIKSVTHKVLNTCLLYYTSFYGSTSFYGNRTVGLVLSCLVLSRLMSSLLLLN